MNRRHFFFYGFFRPLVTVFLRLKFGYKYKLAQDLPETYIVLSNHNTDYDPLLVGASFPRQMYFVGSEHITRWKNAYKFLKFGFAPIMRSKGANAASTVMEVLRAVRGGANVCMFAEGARSYDGVTNPILPATGKMIKSARCALVTYRIEGGYFVSPNWSGANTRRGRLYGAPVNIYTKEQLASMSVDEINAAIGRDLHEDAYARQKAEPARYRGKNIAERMENLLFICPECRAYDTVRSSGDTVRCTRCGHTFKYNEYGMLEGGRFDTVKALSDWQKEEVLRDAASGTVYTAASGSLSTLEKHIETKAAEGPLSLGADALACGGYEIPLADITDLAMHGRRAIVFSAGDKYYELLPSEEANALKFMLLYRAYRHLAL